MLDPSGYDAGKKVKGRKRHILVDTLGLLLNVVDLADRAYGQAVSIVGPTAEILNNQGYSCMLRGDYKRARKVRRGTPQGPGNKYVLNNIQLLEDSYRTGKAIE